MKYVKLILASLSLFAMLTACGEGFKADSVASRGDHDQVVDEGRNLVTPGTTDPEEDDRIRDIYSNELGGLDNQMVAHLANSIKAFELQISVTEHPGGASQNVSANVTMMLGCDSRDHFSFSRSSINESSLTSGDAISLGSDGLYEVILHCTLSDCSEATAMVRRQGDDTTDALVLVGLKLADTQNSSNRVTRIYETRLSEANMSDEVYITALEPDFYLDRACGQGGIEGEVGLDPFGGSGQTEAVDPFGAVDDGFDADEFSEPGEIPPFMGGGSF